MTSGALGKKRFTIDQPDNPAKSTRTSGLSVITQATQFTPPEENISLALPQTVKALTVTESEAVAFA